MRVPPHRQRLGFTLIEIAMALAAGAVILAAIYGVFSRAVHLRDSATEGTRAARVQAHALSVLRNDLRGARISGGTLAATLLGSAQSPDGGFPGYLKFTTTTARDSGNEVMSGDLQEVEYYLVHDPESADQRSGMLVRAIDGNLLAPVQETPTEEPLLAGIESMEVTFFDGNDWQSSWEVTEDETTLPEAVRVRLQPAAPSPEDAKPPAIEVLVPWETQTAIEKPAATEGAAP